MSFAKPRMYSKRYDRSHSVGKRNNGWRKTSNEFGHQFVSTMDVNTFEDEEVNQIFNSTTQQGPQAGNRQPAFAAGNGAKQGVLKPSTKLCEHWRRTGSCSFGDTCWYAHGEGDLRKCAIQYQFNNTGSDNATSDTNGEMSVNGNEGRQKVRTETEIEVSTSNEETSVPVVGSGVPKTRNRVSTNIKGLTVNITSGNVEDSSKEMPLSPAQERWISMSLASANAEKQVAATAASSSVSNENSKSSGASSLTLTSAIGHGGKADGGENEILKHVGGGSRFLPFIQQQQPSVPRYDNIELERGAYPPVHGSGAFAQQQPHQRSSYDVHPRGYQNELIGGQYGARAGGGPQHAYPQQHQHWSRSRGMVHSHSMGPGGYAPHHYHQHASKSLSRSSGVGAIGNFVTENNGVPTSWMSRMSETQQFHMQQNPHMDSIHDLTKDRSSRSAHRGIPSSSSASLVGPPDQAQIKMAYENLLDEICRRQQIIKAGGELETLSAVPPQQGNGMLMNDVLGSLGQKSAHNTQSYGMGRMQSNEAMEHAIMVEKHKKQCIEQMRYLDRIGVPRANQEEVFRRLQSSNPKFIEKTGLPHDAHYGPSSSSTSGNLHQQYLNEMWRQQHAGHSRSSHDLLAMQGVSDLHQQHMRHYHLRRGFVETPIAPLAPPPPMFESLLPDDESFSIWLDANRVVQKSMSKEEAGEQIVKKGLPSYRADSNDSILEKIAQLRVDSVEIGKENNVNHSPNSTNLGNSSKSLGGSLYDLLANENLLDDDCDEMSKKSSTKTPSFTNYVETMPRLFSPTIFEFDTLKLNTLTGEAESQEDSDATLEAHSPTLLIVDSEKTPFIQDKGPCLSKKWDSMPNENESVKKNEHICFNIAKQEPYFDTCFFFATGGTCPFGDACQQSHDLDRNNNVE